MLWAIASSVFVIYLYRKLNAENIPAPASVPTDTIEAELAALNAEIAALERKLGGAGSGSGKP
ncbi:hypothetical protein [Bradyrhizobium sp. SYSU BS000235]|uniref:hypothetical protein n=1 Tax=Bradyrhizobium sp. SYSU BS000235 TaxID=3411332 RepID=UPI003C782F58